MATIAIALTARPAWKAEFANQVRSGAWRGHTGKPGYGKGAVLGEIHG